MPHCSSKPGCDTGHGAPKLLKLHSSEVSQGSVRITPTNHLLMPVSHYRKPSGKRTPAHQQSSGNGQLHPDQGMTPLALGRVVAPTQICYSYCLSITNLSAGQEPTLAPERLSSKINFVYSVGTTCAEDCSESPLQDEAGINFFPFPLIKFQTRMGTVTKVPYMESNLGSTQNSPWTWSPGHHGHHPGNPVSSCLCMSFEQSRTDTVKVQHWRIVLAPFRKDLLELSERQTQKQHPENQRRCRWWKLTWPLLPNDKCVALSARTCNKRTSHLYLAG